MGFTTQQLHCSDPNSASASNGSGGSGTTPAENHSHQLAAEVPKKRTGRKVFRETRHPVYRGVRSRKGDKWVCEVREPNTGTRVWLGTYTNPEMAARAHDVAALAFRGKSACLNFADSAWRLPVPSSTDQIDVRRAAAEAAEMFRPGAETAADGEPENSTAAGMNDENGETSHSDGDVFGYVEEVEEMPRLLSEMAEGLLLSPPRSYGAESDGWSYVESSSNDNNAAADYDWTLWNH